MHTSHLSETSRSRIIKPLLRSMHNPELQGKFREMLTAFYTVLKDADL